MTGWERVLKTMGEKKGAEGHLEDAGRTETLIAVRVAEGAQEGQPGLLKAESEYELLSTNPQGPSSLLAPQARNNLFQRDKERR